MMEGFSRVPLGRPSEPEEVANMVGFLASEAATYMCGVSVSMGGGMAMD
jgi:NAD(P)-dependent dehydrogenase (short-subunit alcohol dehydrogenase family)